MFGFSPNLIDCPAIMDMYVTVGNNVGNLYFMVDFYNDCISDNLSDIRKSMGIFLTILRKQPLLDNVWGIPIL